MAYTIAPLYDDVARVAPAEVHEHAYRQGFAGTIERVVDRVHVWLRRAEERRQLLALDDHMLSDIGISRATAVGEASKPFWQA